MKLKIAFVIDDGLDSTDGVQQYVLTLGNWLTTHGHEVHFLAGETNSRVDENIHSMSRNLRVRFNANTLSTPLPASNKKLKLLLNKEKFDIIHVQVPYSPFMAGRIISKSSDTPVIGTFHILPYGWIQNFAVSLLGLLTKRSLKHFDKMLAVSTPAAELCQKSFGIRAEILPNVVDMKKFKTNIIRKKNPSNRPLKIVFLGRLVERKGCRQLIEAINIINKNNLSKKAFELKIAGVGVEMKLLETLISKYKLEKKVKLEGFIDEADKPKLFGNADISIFPSLGGESFGIVLIEAMAAGSQVVMAGNNPGYASVLGSVPECLVDPKDTNEFASRLAEVMNNEGLRQDINRKQADLVKQYDVDLVGKKLVNIYQNLVKTKKLSQNK